jgi:hypothetical protein
MSNAQEEFAALKALVEDLAKRVDVLENGKARGPKAERPMTETDAYRLKFGDHKALNHKDAAAALGLSYGQVFSCRGGYTFKHVKSGTMTDDGKPLPKGDAK